MLKPTTLLFLISGSVLAVLHMLALKFFLYWKYSWFDMPMHLLGGIVVGLLLYTLSDLKISFVPHRPRWFTVLLFVMTVAVAWEIYEVMIGIPLLDDYAADTGIDLVLGAIGALVSFILGNQFQKDLL